MNEGTVIFRCTCGEMVVVKEGQQSTGKCDTCNRRERAAVRPSRAQLEELRRDVAGLVKSGKPVGYVPTAAVNEVFRQRDRLLAVVQAVRPKIAKGAEVEAMLPHKPPTLGVLLTEIDGALAEVEGR